MVNANTHSPPRMIFPPDEQASHEQRIGITPPVAALVEIVEPIGIGTVAVNDGLPIVPRRVLVNGHDVGLIAEGGVKIHPGDGKTEVTTVTLILMPAHVEIKRATMPTEA